MFDHNAIRKAYPQVVTIDDDTGIFDGDGALVNIDDQVVTAAREELDRVAGIMDEIEQLEAQVTPRRLREHTLGADDGWLVNQEALIQAQRDLL